MTQPSILILALSQLSDRESGVFPSRKIIQPRISTLSKRGGDGTKAARALFIFVTKRGNEWKSALTVFFFCLASSMASIVAILIRRLMGMTEAAGISVLSTG
jgi:hypothetical protein